MSTAAVTPDSGPAELTAWRGGSTEGRRDRAFPMWVALAAACHLLFVIGLYTAPPKILGDPSGSADGVSVEIVTEAEATGRSTVREEAAGEPVTAPPPTPQQTAAPPPQPPARETQPESPAPPAPAAPPIAETAPQPAETAAGATAALKPPMIEPDLLKLDAIQPSAKAQEQAKEAPQEKAPAKQAKTAEAKPAEPKRPEPKARPSKPEQQAKPQQNAKLDLSMPPSMMMAPGGGGAGVSRPPGHTRSGENDVFFRGVVRALQIAMPQLRDTVGIVTVRIILDMNGNLVRTEVLSPSGVPGLDQSVVFSTKQASFPFPPRNATPADLEFRIRYLYNIRSGG